MIKIQLAGDVKRFNYNDKMYYAGTVYMIDDETANYLLDQYDQQSGYSYFEEYVGDLTGVAPTTASDTEGTEQAIRKERPAKTERRKLGAPVGRVIRTQTMKSQPGGSPIEEDDGVPV